MRRLAMFTALGLAASLGWASEGQVDRYVISKVGDIKSVTAPFGVWEGWIALPSDAGSTSDVSVLEFDITTYGYFTDENIGHITIGIGNPTDSYLEGRGIIMGNVTEYPRSEECNPTEDTNAIAVEMYWQNGNCVYGDRTDSSNKPGFELLDATTHHVELFVDDFMGTIEYTVSQLDESGDVVAVASERIFSPNMDKININDNGWWIGEVFSQHDWVIVIDNVSWH